MKTTKKRLLNIVITMSVGINLVMLGGLGYIASVTNEVKRTRSAMDAPVVIYVPRSLASSSDATSQPIATP